LSPLKLKEWAYLKITTKLDNLSSKDREEFLQTINNLDVGEIKREIKHFIKKN